MGECWALRSSVFKSSEGIYEFQCARCDEDDLNAEALFYCENCLKHLCGSCEKLHRFFKDHNVVGKDQMDQWGAKMKGEALKSCRSHDGKERDMYCNDHEVVCCYVCVSTNHRQCTLVQHLPDVAKGIFDKPEFKTMMSDIVQIKEKLLETRDKKKECLKNLHDGYQEILSSVNALSQKLIAVISKIEGTTKQDLQSIVDALNKTVQTQIDSCDDMCKQIEDITDSIEAKGNKNEPLAFIGFKICQEIWKNANSLCKSILTTDDTLVFPLNRDIEEMLSSIKTLYHPNGNEGSNRDLTPQKGKNVAPTSRGTLPEVEGSSGSCDDGATPTSDIENTEPTASPPSEAPRTQVYSVVKVDKYQVRVLDDKVKCLIRGICCLPDGKIVLIDSNNRNVKLLNENYSIMFYCPLSSHPKDICHVGGYEVAVALLKEFSVGIIQVVSAKDRKLVRSRTIQLDHECVSIAYHGGEFYVGSNDSLYIYTKTGKFMRKINTGCVWRVGVRENGERIVISRGHANGIVMIDKLGYPVSSLRDPCLLRVTDFDILDNGCMFVSVHDSHTVLVVSKDWGLFVTLASRGDGVYFPRSVCYSEKQSDLIVGQSGDAIVVMNLQLE